MDFGSRSRFTQGQKKENWLLNNRQLVNLELNPRESSYHRHHKTSRTLLFNIHTLEWDKELLDILNIPKALLPEVVSSSEVVGETSSDILGHTIPISGIAGDQQAALFGQLCTTPGDVKNTYGTGCFCIMNTGEKAVVSKNKMLTTIGYTLGDKTMYALEGSVFVAGALIQWLRDQLHMIAAAADIETLAETEKDNGGVTFIPALAGLGPLISTRCHRRTYGHHARYNTRTYCPCRFRSHCTAYPRHYYRNAKRR